MTTLDAYGPMTNLWRFAHTLKDTIQAWGPEYMNALERQSDLELGETPDLSMTVRHAAVWRQGDPTPHATVWLAGVTDQRIDVDSGQILGDVQLGVFVVVSARDQDANGELLHRYCTVIREIVKDRTGLGGACGGLTMVDEDYTRIEPEQRGRGIASADLSLLAHAVPLGRRPAGPPSDAVPRADPQPPWPTAPTVESAFFHPDLIEDT